MKKYVADFECSTENWNKEKTWVWAWAVCDIDDTENVEIGNNISTFFEFCEKENNPKIYFHNLKYDGSFILDYLENNGYKHIDDRDNLENKTYETIITDLGVYYSITVYFKYNKKNKYIKKVTFYDSLKILNMPVDNKYGGLSIAKTFNLPISKLELDYDTPRKKGHRLNEHERAYIQNDVKIVAKALNILFNQGLTKMTQGANALYDYKQILGLQKFSHYFPNIDHLFEEIKRSYKGGFTYLSPEYKEKDLENITVLDVNSLYPSVLYSKKLPFGEPIYFEGEPKKDNVYDLYIINFSCRFKIKKNKIPTIQIKSPIYSFMPTEYLTSSRTETSNDPVVLTLTSVDFKLFKEHYDINGLEFHYGWKFKSIDTLFKNYIDKWTAVKIQAGKEGNKGMRQLAKIMLNSLYRKIRNKSRKNLWYTIFRRG